MKYLIFSLHFIHESKKYMNNPTIETLKDYTVAYLTIELYSINNSCFLSRER